MPPSRAGPDKPARRSFSSSADRAPPQTTFPAQPPPGGAPAPSFSRSASSVDPKRPQRVVAVLGVKRGAHQGSPPTVDLLEAMAVPLDGRGVPAMGHFCPIDPDYLRHFDSVAVMWWEEAKKKGYVKGSPAARLTGPEPR